MSEAKAVAVLAESPGTVLDIIRAAATDPAFNVDRLSQLVGLYERLTERQAALEFNRALSAFQRQCPVIIKSKRAEVTSQRTGTTITYDFAPLEVIADVVNQPLADVGLSYTWDMKLEEGRITATCILRHVNGHRETATFTCPVSGSPMMSEPQKHAGTLTFTRRYSLIQVLGLALHDPEPDKPTAPKITPQQLDQMEDMITESGAKRDKFAEFLGLAADEWLGNLNTEQWEAGIRALRQKIAKGSKALE